MSVWGGQGCVSRISQNFSIKIESKIVFLQSFLVLFFFFLIFTALKMLAESTAVNTSDIPQCLVWLGWNH